MAAGRASRCWSRSGQNPTASTAGCRSRGDEREGGTQAPGRGRDETQKGYVRGPERNQCSKLKVKLDYIQRVQPHGAPAREEGELDPARFHPRTARACQMAEAMRDVYELPDRRSAALCFVNTI